MYALLLEECCACTDVSSVVSGTLRTNLDPFGIHDDARLWDALKRSYLVEERRQFSVDGGDDDATLNGTRTPTNRFTLDSPIEDEGGNLSVGQVGSVLLCANSVILFDCMVAFSCFFSSRHCPGYQDPHSR